MLRLDLIPAVPEPDGVLYPSDFNNGTQAPSIAMVPRFGYHEPEPSGNPLLMQYATHRHDSAPRCATFLFVLFGKLPVFSKRSMMTSVPWHDFSHVFQM